jgi:hypothetical protein
VAAQPSGGYITTYTDPNGDVISVYAATPMTISPGAPTSNQITVNGATVTEYSAWIHRPIAEDIGRG